MGPWDNDVLTERAKIECCHCRKLVAPTWVEWEHGFWRCPNCAGGWATDEQRRAVMAAHDAGKPYPMDAGGAYEGD